MKELCLVYLKKYSSAFLQSECIRVLKVSFEFRINPSNASSSLSSLTVSPIHVFTFQLLSPVIIK